MLHSSPMITGLGLVTPLGNSVEETWQALLTGRFIRDHARSRLEGPPSRIHQLGISAAREALTTARWSEELIGDPSTALVVGTSKGPVETWLTAPPGHIVENPYITAGRSCEFGLSELADGLGRDLKLGSGPKSTLSAACASGIHALIHAILLLRSGVARRALVVAAEASVHPLFVGSFKRLGVLPNEGVGCKPFDIARGGFLMSEAAAAVCLEMPESTQTRPIAKIDRFTLVGDAFHITGIDPAGRALKYMLRQVVGSEPVDLIHAHATGTDLNDPVELAAIEETVHDEHPAIYSHKGALGHSLGAAGLVSVVLNCVAHQHGIIPPNVQTTQPLATNRVSISHEAVQRPVRRSIALAAGFGGAMGAISLRTP